MAQVRNDRRRAARRHNREQGKAGKHVISLCYTIAESRSVVRLWLVSDAKGPGADHAVTAVTAQTMDDGPTADCPALALGGELTFISVRYR